MTTDAIIVGSGVIGSAIALELSRVGWDVVVVDRGHAAGHGSTSASSAVIRFDYSTYDGIALAWEASRCWASWQEHLDVAGHQPLADYRRTGAIATDVPIVAKKRTLELYRRIGVEAEEWSPEDLKSNFPAISPNRFWPPKGIEDPAFWNDPEGELGVTYVAEGGFIEDSLLATYNLAAAARNLGARFRYGSDVVQITRANERIAGIIMGSGEKISAPVVVNAAGPWSGRVNLIAGVGSDFNIRVRPLRVEVHQVLAPLQYAGISEIGPVVGDLDLGIYVRPAPGGFMLVGGTEPECDQLDWLDSPDNADFHCTQSIHNRQMLRASRRFPALSVPNSPHGVVGIYDVSEDWVPIYDRTELPGYYVAMGTSGNQFKNAPVVGQIMAALIMAVEEGCDHDKKPIKFNCSRTGNCINIGSFSRLRKPNESSTGTVLG
jgi:sarcosine oxidase, subunit beta